MKWTRGLFSITSRDGTKLEVEGYFSGAYGIHNDYHEWRITHIPSGLLIESSSRLKHAKAKAEILEEWRSRLAFDWAQTYNDSKIWQLARQARIKAREGGCNK